MKKIKSEHIIISRKRLINNPQKNTATKRKAQEGKGKARKTAGARPRRSKTFIRG